MASLPLVMIALVCGGTLNSSAANFNTAVKGAASGTLNLQSHTQINKIPKLNSINSKDTAEIDCSKLETYTLKGSFGSDVSVTLNDTFPPAIVKFFRVRFLDLLFPNQKWKREGRIRTAYATPVSVSLIRLYFWASTNGLFVVSKEKKYIIFIQLLLVIYK